MSEVGPADRSRLLRSKRTELSGIVTSRKRKLRELYAVCDNEGPIPQITYSNPDDPPNTLAENRYLEVTDLLKERLFDESNLPTRRQLRSETAKQRSLIRKPSPDPRNAGSSRKQKAQRDASRSRTSRPPTPSGKSDGGATPTNDNGTNGRVSPTILLQRSTSKSSQTDSPADSTPVFSEIGEENFQNVSRPQAQQPSTPVPPKALETERIEKGVESRPNSPGVDPRKVMPISAEDAANLPGPLIDGLGSHDGHHQAKTIHLPPRDVQEKRLHDSEAAHKAREKEKAKEKSRLAIQLPPRDGGHQGGPLSSPGSTSGAHSATTSAIHEASTDTSPDNEGSRYNARRDDDARTPPELRPTPEEVAEKEEHDRLLNAQIQINRAEILGSSPTAPDKQLRMEEQAASLSAVEDNQNPTEERGNSNIDKDESPRTIDTLTKEASEVVEDVVDDTDPVVEPRTSEDVEMPDVVAPNEKTTGSKAVEVPDSENEGQTPVEAMDVAPVLQSVDSAPKPVTESDNSSTTPVSSTLCRTSSTPAAAAQPPLERMTTRIASHTIRQKSVAEIIGDIPRPSSLERSSTANSSSASRSTTPQTPRLRSLLAQKEKERSKLSTVTFSKRPNKPPLNDTALMPTGSQGIKSEEDYLKPLFIATATSDRQGIPKLDHLLSSAPKTITTANAYVPIHESQSTKVLKRIYHLQSAGKWSLRQPKRAAEPNRPTFHWDVLLQEAKWMRTDFREERKWKATVARNLVFACAEWVEASPEDRKLLQIKATPPPFFNPPSGDADTEINETPNQTAPHISPGVFASSGIDFSTEDSDEEPRLDLLETVAPTAIFALQDDDVVFGLRRSPTADKLLNELPMYGAPLRVPQSDILTSEFDPDRLWRRPALPISKFVEGRLELKSEGPPMKRSRYQYEEEEEDDDEVVFGEQGQNRPRLVLPPESSDVALFDPQHKHIRDRIHSSHQFRPPSEFPMPLQSFFETRIPSQWTWDEDNELKGLVRDYTYNWSLISSLLTSKSMFSAGNERRTPWECFERWIHLEGLPNDMQKTHYFRAYTSRIDAANRNVVAQATAAQTQAMANGQAQPPPRRRTTTSVRVEQRRKTRHLALVDAMRKLAKKRETSIQKQQQAAGMAAMRKANENQQPAQPRNVHTPQEFSRLKHDRDEQFKERLLQLQQRQDAQRKAILLQQRNAQGQPAAGPPNGGSAPRPPVNGLQPPHGAPGSGNLQVPGQNRGPPRPMPPQMSQQMTPQMRQQMQNSLQVPQVPMNGIAPAPMQAMQGQLPMPNPAVSVGLINQAAQTAEQQRAMIQMQQQGKPPGQSPQTQNSPPRANNGMPQPPGFPMQNMMAFNANNQRLSSGTPPANGMIPSPGHPQHGQAGSPRVGPHSQARENYVRSVEFELKKNNPNATPQELVQLVTEHLKRSVAQHSNGMGPNGLAQSAMNAAAGGPSNAMNGQARGMPSAVNESSPQLYAQMLRQQQENQQKADQARAAANSALAASQGQIAPTSNGQQAQGHAHRNSSGSTSSVK